MAGFDPSSLTITVADTVSFDNYIDVIETDPHNVVADDGSFRCARGCDGEAGSRRNAASRFGLQR